MQNSNLKRTGAQIIFVLISVVLLVWTGYLTMSFLSTALPRAFWLVPVIGLVVFDAGMIGWLFVYLYLAEGAMQRAVAIGLCLFNLIGVGLMTITEIVLGGQTLTDVPAMLGTAAIWGVGIWTFVNIAALVIYHLSSPDARIAAAIQDEKDATVNQALQNMRDRRAANALALSERMGGGMYAALLTELLADADRDGVPDLYERRENVTGDVGKSTHDAPRQEPTVIPLAQPGQGGNGPGGRKLGTPDRPM